MRLNEQYYDDLPFLKTPLPLVIPCRCSFTMDRRILLYFRHTPHPHPHCPLPFTLSL